MPLHLLIIRRHFCVQFTLLITDTLLTILFYKFLQHLSALLYSARLDYRNTYHNPREL